MSLQRTQPVTVFITRNRVYDQIYQVVKSHNISLVAQFKYRALLLYQVLLTKFGQFDANKVDCPAVL